MARLEQLLVRFSELVIEQPAIAELDINPLLASADRLLALDARVILHPAGVAPEDLPRPAIRPYPRQYVGSWATDDGRTEYDIRPIRPEDESLVVDFHGRLSSESVYQRYFTRLGYEERIAHERLVRVCFTDYDREIALVAERQDAETGKVVIGSVGRLIRLHGSETAEFSLIVADDDQGHGLGTQMMRRLIDVARAERIERVVAEILEANGSMVSICRDLGFTLSREELGDTVQAELRLA